MFEFDFDLRDTNKYLCSSTQLDSSADKETKTTESTDGRGGNISLEEETTRMALLLGSINQGILPQPTLFLDEIIPALDTFFVHIILPMLLTGQSRYSEKGSLTTSDSSDCTTFCWCGGKEEGNMVACDNPMCETEWFHFECAGLKCKPR